MCIPNSLVVKNDVEEGWDFSWLQVWLNTISPRAIVLSGGNDIGEFPVRDALESYLLDWASKYEKPLLGLCRGMQMMGYWAGMSLKPVDGHVRVLHQLIHKTNDRLPLPNVVNSYHNWCLSACPQNFEVMAVAEKDGVIEAIRHEQFPWEGWMWHPEREEVFNMIDTLRMKRLLGEKD